MMGNIKLIDIINWKETDGSTDELNESGKIYKFFSDDNDSKEAEVEANTPEEADEKISKITGKDPKKITKWTDSDSTTEAVNGQSNDGRMPVLNVNRLMAALKPMNNIEEDNSTSNLDGGEGQQRTPYAFRNSIKKPSDTIYNKSMTEATYKDWRADESESPRQKINKSILNVAKSLVEIERTIGRVGKLKTEIGANNDIYWKRTQSKFVKINERFLKIASKLRDISQ